MYSTLVLTLKLLVVSYITAKRQLIHNRIGQRDTWNQSYDFIIVGAGGSGCVVANRLSEDPNVNVLLLELGGSQDAIYTDIPGMNPLVITSGRPEIQLVYYSEPQSNLNLTVPGGRIREPVGSVIGGSTSHNHMNFCRAQRKDLDNWVNSYGAKGWSFKEVLPFYLRFENNTDMNIVRNNPDYHGVNGPVQISTPSAVHRILELTQIAYNEMGFMTHDINAVNQTGTMIMQNYRNPNGFRSLSGNAYVDPNPHPNNLHIVIRARVLRILFNNLTAVGVEFDRNDTSYRVYVRKEVIVSAGPYQTPQLLMLSGIGPRNHLQSFGIPVLSDLPVGNNFQYLATVSLSSKISRNLFTPSDLTTDNLIELYFNHSGPLSVFPSLILYFSTSYNLNRDWPNIGVSGSVLNGQLVLTASIGHCKSRGMVGLQSSNPYIPPKLDLNLYSVVSDLDNAIEATKFILFVMEKTSLAQYVSPNSFESVGCPKCRGRYMYECTDSIRCYILSVTSVVYHTVGSCRMGDVRNDVVVDPNLLVKHVNNLRICDTSIIPELPNSGTTADALMIGEKCSQIIKDCYHMT